MNKLSNMNILRGLCSLLFFSLLATTFNSCVKENFDEPPVGDLPVLETNATIADLKGIHELGTDADEVTQDWIVDAVVVADDESGNLFRQIVVADETGGITLRLDQVGIYNDFPVGTRIYIKAMGLYVGDYNGLYQINGSPEDAIAELLIPEFILPAEFDVPVTPTLVSLAELQNTGSAGFRNLTNTLITLEDVEFVDADAGVSFADPTANPPRSLNRTVRDCQGNTIIVRTSGYADFAGEETPEGNGTLTAVLTVFRDTPQLLLREPGDLDMDGPRCGSQGVEGDLISIQSLRDAFNGGATTAPDNSKIKGVVISDQSTGNITGRNLYLQDETGGIVIRFNDNHSFELGEEIEIGVSGLELSEFNGLLQVNNVPNIAASSLGAGDLPDPRTVTVADILANAEAWESTLVTIEDATLSGSATFNGAVTLSDGTGSITIFTRSSADFADDALPTGEVTVTGIVSEFNDPQLILRSRADVNGGMTGGGDPESISAADLRALFESGVGTVPANRLLRGVVTSDQSNGNMTSRNLTIQDATGGIVIRFTEDHPFALGEEIEVNIGGQELSEFRGLLQVNNVPLSNAVSYGNGTLPDPRTATIAEIEANNEAWESTLVRIENVTFSGGTTFTGTLTISDGTGTLDVFIRNDASFAGAAVPNGPVTLLGVVSEYNDATQLTIRNLGDINP